MAYFSAIISKVSKQIDSFSVNLLWVYALFFLLAMVLRVSAPQRFPFNFDQVQIAQNSQKIFSGDLVLIGPRTGPAQMFTGPLIYYITAPFHALLSDPYVVVATAVTISIATGLILLLLLRSYLEEKTGVVFFCLWAISPLLFWFDRVPWNPNLTMLAASLSFLPLFAPKLKLKEILLIATGVFLGYQAHFSGLFLLPLVVLSLIYLHRQAILKMPAVLLIPLAFCASLFPTLVFDSKHNWLSVSGLISLVTNKDLVDSFWLFSRLTQKLYVVIETIGKVLVTESVPLMHVFVGLFFLLSFVFLLKHSAAGRRLFIRRAL